MGEKSSFSFAAVPDRGGKYSTWTPKIPKIMKKAQQMRTIFPIGLKEEIKVSTTSFRPGALLMTLGEKRQDKETFNFDACPVTAQLLLLCTSLLYLQAGISSGNQNIPNHIRWNSSSDSWAERGGEALCGQSSPCGVFVPRSRGVIPPRALIPGQGHRQDPPFLSQHVSSLPVGLQSMSGAPSAAVAMTTFQTEQFQFVS